ncbi:hypothetical protein ACFL0M_03625 [Thermodesulfobacteriota bacterium]
MSKKWFLMMLLVSASFYYVSTASATPSVTSISGAVVNGSSVTITGTIFGAGPTVHKWDDFEDATHTVGQTIGDGPGVIEWVYNAADANKNEPKVSNTSPKTNSTKYIRCTYDGGSNKYMCNFYYQHGATMDPVYVTWYMRWDNAGSGETDNEKFWRIFTGNDLSNWPPPYLSMARIGGDNASINWISSHGSSSDQKWLTAPDENEWIRMEFYGEESSNNVADGLIIVTQQTSIGGTFSDIWSDDTQETRDNGKNWNSIFWGSYAAMAAGRLYYHDYDDIYIANSRARVEIGNNSNWANITHREIQIPTAWTEDVTPGVDSITITVNRGSFDPCKMYYLFVVDENGVPSAGEEIKIVTSAGEAPCPPTGLLIVP